MLAHRAQNLALLFGILPADTEFLLGFLLDIATIDTNQDICATLDEHNHSKVCQTCSASVYGQRVAEQMTLSTHRPEAACSLLKCDKSFKVLCAREKRITTRYCVAHALAMCVDGQKKLCSGLITTRGQASPDVCKFRGRRREMHGETTRAPTSAPVLARIHQHSNPVLAACAAADALLNATILIPTSEREIERDSETSIAFIYKTELVQ